ncbi:MAG: histidine kinase [Bacteroidota bacterium]
MQIASPFPSDIPLRKGILLLVLLACLGCRLTAQTAYIDSVRKLLQVETDSAEQARFLVDLAYELRAYQTDTAIAYAFRGKTIAHQLNLTLMMARAYRALGLISSVQGNVPESVCYHDSAYAFYELRKDTLGMVAILNNMSLLFIQNGECIRALENYMKGLRLRKKEDWQQYILRVNYGWTLANCRQFEEAVDYVRENQSGIKRLKKKNEYIQYQFDVLMGSIFFQTEQYDSCLHYYEKCLDYALHDADDPGLLSANYNGMGLLHVMLGNFDLGQYYITKSDSMDRALGFDHREGESMMAYALLYSKKGEHQQAVPFFDKSIPLLDESAEDISLQEVYARAGESNLVIKRYGKAYEYLRKAYDMQDSLLSLDIQTQIKRLDKEYQIEQLQNQLAKEELTNKRRENMLTQFILGAIGFSIILFLVYMVILSVMRRRRAIEENRALELEYTVLRAQMNPHFIFNSLNSIQGYFAENNFEQGNEFLGAFGQLIRRVMDMSSYKTISLKDELDTLFLYLQLEQLRLQDQLFFEINLSSNIQPEKMFIPPLILQPFVENAIWHGIVPRKTKGKIHINGSYHPQNNSLLFTIKDDGVGLYFKQEQRRKKLHKSKGIEITKERLGEQGNIQLKEWYQPDGSVGGTEVQLTIPL